MGTIHCPKSPRPSRPKIPPKGEVVALVKIENEDDRLMREGQEIALRQEQRETELARVRSRTMRSVRTQAELQVGISVGAYALIASAIEGTFFYHPTLAIVLLALNVTAAAVVNAGRRYGV